MAKNLFQAFSLLKLKDFLSRIFQKNKNIVGTKENITRYILSSSHFSTARVKTPAFLPQLPPTEKSNISVYRTTNLTNTEIWVIGDTYVAARRGDSKRILARGDLTAGVIFEKNLNVVPKKIPHDLHAEILGWPIDEAIMRQKALELANAAALTIRQTS